MPLQASTRKETTAGVSPSCMVAHSGSDSCSAYENAECAANMAGCWFFFSKLDGLRGKELFHAAVDRRPNFMKHACVQISMHLFEE